jgi:hypothetical protein
VQTALLAWTIQRRIGAIDWRGLRVTALKSAGATLVMSAVWLIAIRLFPDGKGRLYEAVTVVIPILLAAAAYFAAGRWFGLDELRLLLRGQAREKVPIDSD